MSYLSEEIMRILRRLAKADAQFRELEQTYLRLERDFANMIGKLSTQEQNIAWDFVCTSDALDRRLLEIACDYLVIAHKD